MLRSLSSSITGLQNHQTRMDVIGNNIANVNTTGFKAGRVTFSESFSQLMQGSTKPNDEGNGGSNPLQVGLGMSVGSIDNLMSQGNFESTGQVLDLAIEGNAFFAVSDGSGTYYTRNGSFEMDANGQIVMPTNGMVLQGRMADSEGNFPAGTAVGNISVPFSEQSPAVATTEVQYSRNLNQDAGPKGSILYSQRFLHHAQGADLLAGAFNSKGESLGMSDNDVITVSATINGVYVEDTYVVGADTGEIDTMDELGTAIASTLGLTYGTELQLIDDPADANRGAFMITNPGSNIVGFQVSSDNPLSTSYLNKALNLPSNIAAGDTVYTDTLRSPAEAGSLNGAHTGDLIAELFDANGDSLGLQTGDAISITGSVGEDAVTTTNPLTVDLATTTIGDLLLKIRDELQLPVTDGTPDNNSTVSINAVGSDDGIPDGTVVIRGAQGAAFSLENIRIQASNSDNANPAPTAFNANTSFTTEQDAQDAGVVDTSITIYDESGASHVLTMSFVHTARPNEWDWKISMEGQEEILSGGSGKLTFGEDGTVASFVYDNEVSNLRIDPKNGSNFIAINLNVGGPGNFQGITQFSSANTVSAVKQDGNTTGSLADISVDSEGYIEGTFTNGTSRRLAQVMVVDFTNPSGLLRLSDSVYSASSNSGDPVFGMPGTQSSSTIKPGALEMSNVDLAKEFTNMITTQRGYQANARVITVSDTMLEELVNLKR